MHHCQEGLFAGLDTWETYIPLAFGEQPVGKTRVGRSQRRYKDVLKRHLKYFTV